jgi:uncharacterized protein YjbJ (UPF0337 family)
MALDNMKHKAEELTGKAKQQTGAATGNQDMEAEGAAQETKGNLKQAGDKVKDAFKS